MANLSLTIQQELLDKIREEASLSTPPKTVTALVQEILTMYYKPKNTRTLTPEDLEAIRKLLDSQPIVPISTPTPHLFEESPDSGFLHKGLIIPETGYLSGVRRRRELSPIEPGDTAMRKLKERGIEPADVIKAKRNWRAGREYNKELEKYFNLI